ncbi:MAG: PAS domain S-box protein [Methanolobus sp.]|nr:PAS domain S-box protein [Methanolobus sp.]
MEHIKVLLIEDNPAHARLINEMLAEEKKISFDLQWKNDLSNGLKRLAEGSIDLVLLDLNLPDSKGLNTFDKTQTEAPQIPVVVLTSLGDETLAITAVRNGAQDYLIKGQVNSSLLARAIRYAIERKQAEEKIKEAEMRYRTLFDQSPDGVLIIDPLTGIAVEFNEAAHSMLGYTREEFKQLRIFDYEAKETFDEMKYHVETVLSEGKDDFETRHRTKNGEIRDFFVTVQKLELAGKVVFHCIFHDLTDRRQAEEALRESERRSREILQKIQLVGIMLDVHGNIVFCNDFLLKLTGWHRDEIIGRNWIKIFIPPERQEEARQIFNQLLTEGIPVQYESDILTKTGEKHLISFNNVFLRDLKGNITGVASIGEDITVHSQAEEALRRGAR